MDSTPPDATDAIEALLQEHLATAPGGSAPLYLDALVRGCWRTASEDAHGTPRLSAVHQRLLAAGMGCEPDQVAGWLTRLGLAWKEQ